MNLKLLSVDPSSYPDSSREGIRRIISKVCKIDLKIDEKIPSKYISYIRIGTTVATNALLERKGKRIAFVTTKGFGDLLVIGDQSREKIFDLRIEKPSLLYDMVVEIDERVYLDKNCHEQTNNSKFKGVSGEYIRVIKKPDEKCVRKKLQAVFEKGIRYLAVSLMHSYTWPNHEEIIRKIALEIGFKHVSLSSKLIPMIKIVPRAYTTCADAYLTPLIQVYVNEFIQGFDDNLMKNVDLQFMQSDGGLTPSNKFSGFRAVLSGPAGGVIGAVKCTKHALKPHIQNWKEEHFWPSIISFDMGGTSTDVSRFGSSPDFEFNYENKIAGVVIQAPQLAIDTVAAGGGSLLKQQNGLLDVGPESAGAYPGPICYGNFAGNLRLKENFDENLTITDANLILGRLRSDYFPKIFGPNKNEELDLKMCKKSFKKLFDRILGNSKLQNLNNKAKNIESIEALALGFIQIANEKMCRLIRSKTQGKGYNISDHVLCSYGGAGGQHACSIAKLLGIKTIFIHKYSSILSAYGIGMADSVLEQQEACFKKLLPENFAFLESRLNLLVEKTCEKMVFICRNCGVLNSLGVFNDKSKKKEYSCQCFNPCLEICKYMNLHFDGTDTKLMLKIDEPLKQKNYFHEFCERFKFENGFIVDNADVIVEDLRCRINVKNDDFIENAIMKRCDSTIKLEPEQSVKVYFEEGQLQTSIYLLDNLMANDEIFGPALIIDQTSTIVLEPNCIAKITDFGHIFIDVLPKSGQQGKIASCKNLNCDPIQLAIFGNRFMSIAEQQGKVLQRTSISTNIKERLDFSCAIFGQDGGLVANAPHLPVHLGAMQEAVRYQIQNHLKNIKPGNSIVTNHPKAGGSHLPDITVITPVFEDDNKKLSKNNLQHKPVFYVASRGHHSDIGGISPGSMPPFSKYLYEEGAAIESFLLVKNGHFDQEGIEKILQDPLSTHLCTNEINLKNISKISGSRNLNSNVSDLKAQVSSNNRGIVLLQQLIKEYGLQTVQAYMIHIQNAAENAVRCMLREICKINKNCSSKQIIDDKEFTCFDAIDYMDDGTQICLKLLIEPLSGQAIFDFNQTGAQVYGNTNCPRAITKSAIIYCLRCLVDQEIPLNEGCLKPIKIIFPKSSCILNPSNNAAVVGGNVLTSQRVTDVVLKAFRACAASQGCMNNLTFGDENYGYYETICGGSGAGPSQNGANAVHTHMTNTRITDPELLERRFPVILRKFCLRPNSGGKGKFTGGNGVIREIEFLKPTTVGILSERRTISPYGMEGGDNGETGINYIKTKNGLKLNLGGKNTYEAENGDRIQICTPGGGGQGVTSNN